MELSSTEQDLTEMIPAGLIRALQHEDQINVQNEESLWKLNTKEMLITLKKHTFKC